MVTYDLLPQQTDFEERTGLPRWGCYFLSLAVWPQIEHNCLFSFDEYLHVYHKCMGTLVRVWGHPTGADEAPILEMVDESTRELRCNRPDLALQAWLDCYRKNIYQAHLTRTSHGWEKRVPREETFRLWRVLTANGNGHWGYGTPDHAKLLYNPDLSLSVGQPTGHFVGFHVEEV